MDYKDKYTIMQRYDLTYSSYDELYSQEQFKKYEESFSDIFDDIYKKNVVNLLDIGCGTGLFLKFINSKIKPIYYIGIDLSLNSVKLAKEKERKHNIADFIVGDAENPPVRLDTIDIAVSYTVIHHFRNPLGFIYRIINKVRWKMVISAMKKDSSAIILDDFSLIKNSLDRDLKYIKIIGEKDIIIVFELGHS